MICSHFTLWGNPTSYRGATLTWRGRELETYTKGNIQIIFSYDVDGMRYQKLVKTDGVETARYDYVYSEGRLVLVTYTADGVSDTARFIYDSYGEPRGFVFNNTATYLYLKNAQGDITGIVNEYGAVILTCTYDAWGRVNFGSSDMAYMTLAAKLSQINPFTYRGYCYDYDIGMYYLQSRYYDPETGRFINADSTDYLGATGTLLSYNLFAYCENDPVNYTDATGTWAYDVHAGYRNKYSKKRAVRVKNQMFYEMRYTVYGTYEWALECGYPDYAAWMIAQSNYLVDTEFSAITVNNFNDQSWHFNVNTSGMDSRDAKLLVCLFAAGVYFCETIEDWDAGYIIRAKVKLGKAYQYLGAALHPLQDKYAHTKKVTNYRNIKGIKFYEHKIYDFKNPKKKADDAKAHDDVVFGVVKNETKNILNTFMKKYSYVIKRITPDENLWFLFPNSYKKATKYVDLD